MSASDGPRSAPAARRVALITGGAGGIALALAERLGRDGTAVVLGDVRADAVEAAAAGLCERGQEAIAVRLDVSSRADVEAFVAAALDAYGRIDALVNCAGLMGRAAPIDEVEDADWDTVIAVDLTSAFMLCRAVVPHMRSNGGGAIVNVASIAGIRGVADRAAYNASKHGLVGLTRTLAAEWGGRGVRVNAVCPGWVKTEMDDDAQDAGLYVDDDIVGQVPMGRFASPDDVASAIAFLADPARSGFVNGATLSVDGGWASDASWTSLRLTKRT